MRVHNLSVNIVIIFTYRDNTLHVQMVSTCYIYLLVSTLESIIAESGSCSVTEYLPLEKA